MKESQQKNRAKAANIPPDKVKLNQIQAQRLSSITNVSIKELERRDIPQLSESLKWKIDPEYFRFRRICGQVVRWDAGTGQYHPVPFATVHLMDTERDFLVYFPYQLKWTCLY